MGTQSGSRILERVQTIVSEIDFDLDSKTESDSDSTISNSKSSIEMQTLTPYAHGGSRSLDNLGSKNLLTIDENGSFSDIPFLTKSTVRIGCDASIIGFKLQF